MRIKAKLFPYDGKINVDAGLDRLAQPKPHSPQHRPFLLRYQVEGERYIQILGFSKHQSPHNTEKNSVIPSFNGELTVKEPLLRGGVQDAQEQGTRNLNRILYSFPKGEWEGITDEDRAAWAKAYPACEVPRELSAMIEWLKANPEKGKKRNYRRFIVNWLARSQERGGGMKSNPKESAIARERRVGSNRQDPFLERITDEARQLIPKIDSEFDKISDDPKFDWPFDRQQYRTKRLNEIFPGGKQ
jgi:hypothetical protein